MLVRMEVSPGVEIGVAAVLEGISDEPETDAISVGVLSDVVTE